MDMRFLDGDRVRGIANRNHQKTMKTTILGLLAAAAAAIQTVVQQGGSIQDWKTWILPVVLALLGYAAKDSNPVK